MTRFRCATPDEFAHWQRGGTPMTSHYTGMDAEWQFCLDAWRAVCRGLRREGRCVRSESEWRRLMANDGRREA